MKFINPLLLTCTLLSVTAHAQSCHDLYGAGSADALTTCQAELTQQPNNPTLQFYTGFVYYKQNDYTKALSLFEQSANQGFATAQFNLGVMYFEGVGTKQDYTKAFELLHQSATQGFAPAQAMIGIMYQHGQGVKQDNKKAIEWYTKSANQDDVNAQVILGSLYMAGEVVKEDIKTAKYWFGKACDNGYKDACKHR